MLMYMQPEVAESAARWSKNRVDRIERGEMAKKTGETGQKTRNLQKTLGAKKKNARVFPYI